MAEDAIKRFNNHEFFGFKLVVEQYCYRGGDFRYRPTAAPNPMKFRPKNASYRLYITGLQENTTWQDIKDFARQGGRSVAYTDVFERNKRVQ